MNEIQEELQIQASNELQIQASEGLGCVLWAAFFVVLVILAIAVIHFIIKYSDQIDAFTI